MGPTELAIEYWTQDSVEAAKGVIARHMDWGYAAESDFKYLLTPAVREALGDLSAKTALEVGCGIGRLLLPMATQFAEVIGIDVCDRMLELAERYLADFPEHKWKIDWRKCDGKTIPVVDRRADFIYSLIVFQHLPDIVTVRSYLLEIRRVLIPGGVARIQTFKGPAPTHWDPHWGCYFESLDAFVAEFERVGLRILEAQEDVPWSGAERREPVEKYWLWVTAQKPI